MAAVNINNTDNIEEAAPGIFRIRVPLPNNPLKELNAWFLEGESSGGGRNLLIDTGFNRPECEDALKGGLEALGAKLEATDIFITHLHADHCGLMKKMSTPGMAVYCSKADGDIINAATESVYWENLDEVFVSYGYPVAAKRQNIEKHPGWKYNVREKVEFTPVDEGFTIDVGEYSLRCVWTPGHTPGQMCLYDEEKKFFFCADHILADITPNITIEQGMDDPLHLYLNSLKKVEGLDVRKVFPGHRNPPDSIKGRIDELYRHHLDRLSEIISILGESTMTAYEVAAQMEWDIKFDNWEAFPSTQKWFATGEAIAHLQYLYYEGKVSKFLLDGIWRYSNVSG